MGSRVGLFASGLIQFNYNINSPLEGLGSDDFLEMLTIW